MIYFDGARGTNGFPYPMQEVLLLLKAHSKKRSMAPCMVEIPRDNNKQEDCVSKWMNLAGLSKSELVN